MNESLYKMLLMQQKQIQVLATMMKSFIGSKTQYTQENDADLPGGDELHHQQSRRYMQHTGGDFDNAQDMANQDFIDARYQGSYAPNLAWQIGEFHVDSPEEWQNTSDTDYDMSFYQDSIDAGEMTEETAQQNLVHLNQQRRLAQEDERQRRGG